MKGGSPRLRGAPSGLVPDRAVTGASSSEILGRPPQAPWRRRGGRRTALGRALMIPDDHPPPTWRRGNRTGEHDEGAGHDRDLHLGRLLHPRRLRLLRPGGCHWGGYWGKQGPRAPVPPGRLVRHRATHGLRGHDVSGERRDPALRDDPKVRTSGTCGRCGCRPPSSPPRCSDTLGWPNATIVSGDAVEIVTRLKADSDVPLRSQASLSLNRALLAAGLVDRLQVTIFPVISGRSGTSPILAGAGDFDLELLDSRVLDGLHPRSSSTGRPPTDPGPPSRWGGAPGPDGPAPNCCRTPCTVDNVTTSSCWRTLCA